MARTAHPKTRAAVAAPVPTVDDLPILSDEERARMLVSLQAAQDRIAAGRYVEHDSRTFVDRLMKVRADALRNKKA